MTAQGTQEPPGQSEVERLQTEWTGRWLCICQQAGFCLNPPLRLNRDRHPGQSQLYAGLLPFKFSGCPAARCPFRPSSFLQSRRSEKTRFFELGRHEAVIGELTLPATTRRSGFFSIAAIHFHARSVAVIDPRVARFSAWPAGMQRLQSLAGMK